MSATVEELTQRLRTRRDLPPPEVRRALRRAAGVPMQDVAAIVGVTRQAVALWESGSREPRNTNLASYSEVLRALRQAVTD
jgi:DNA-binding transcriptional regulator YiaG